MASADYTLAERDERVDIGRRGRGFSALKSSYPCGPDLRQTLVVEVVMPHESRGWRQRIGRPGVLPWGAFALVVLAGLGGCKREVSEQGIAVGPQGLPGSRGDSGQAEGSAADGPQDPELPGVDPDAELSPFARTLVAGWRSAGVEVAPLADDAEFHRRLALDLTGTIPTAQAAERFVLDEAADKRERLVDALLASDDYARYWAEVYAGLLLGQALPTRKKLRAGTVDWLEEALREGRPYDAMVAEILTATGDIPEGREGSYLFVRGRQNQVEALAGATARIFLGVQIECAQCHDHPYYDQYKREDFYRFAAYFGRTRVRIAKKEKNKKKGPLVVAIKERPRGEVHLPLADGSPGAVIEPRFLGREVTASEGESRRETLVRAIRGSDLLAKAAVNRIWSQLLGRGLVEPWDDLVGEGDKSHPEGLTLLAESFAEGGYDHRALLREIVLSPAYQRSSAAGDGARGDQGAEDGQAAARVFARASVRPLSAYQLFNAIALATGLGDSDRPAYRRLVEERRDKALAQYLFIFADDEMAEAESFAGNVPQALLLLNGDLSNAGVRERAGGTVKAAVEAAGGSGEAAAVSALYLSAYGRRPDDAEIRAGVDFIRARGKDAKDGRAYEDLLYALLLSSEFVTNH